MRVILTEKGGAETAAKQSSAPRKPHSQPQPEVEGVCFVIIPHL